jgi:hypothetical protein
MTSRREAVAFRTHVGALPLLSFFPLDKRGDSEDISQ